MQTFLLLLHLSAQLSRQPNRFKQSKNKQIPQNSSPLKVIRRRDLRHGRERVPPALKKRERRDRTVRDFPVLRVADISISVAELHLDHLPTDLGGAVGVSPGGLTEERYSEGVASGPRDGDASEWGLEAVVERVDGEATGL